MLFRSTPYVTDFIANAFACRNNPIPEKSIQQPSEQDCFLHLIETNEHQESDHVLMIPQWKMNAFPEEIPCFDRDRGGKWERGMFVIHFAGAWAHVNSSDAKGDLMKKYHGHIVDY